MLGVVVVYLGLIATFLGGVSLLRPLTFLAIHSRRQAALILALGFIVVVIGESLRPGCATERPRFWSFEAESQQSGKLTLNSRSNSQSRFLHSFISSFRLPELTRWS